MQTHGYSDSIHHALAFCAKHHPGRVSRYDGHNPLLTTPHVAALLSPHHPRDGPPRYAGHNPLLTTATVAVILSRHQADDATIVAGVLKQLMDASPPDRRLALIQKITLRFRGLVAAAVGAATDPRFDPLGRERTWKASRFEALARLAASSARVAD